MQGGDHVEAIAVLEAEIDHRKGGRGFLHGSKAAGDGVGDADIEAALLHRPFEARQEGLVVIDEEKRAIRREKVVNRAHWRLM